MENNKTNESIKSGLQIAGSKPGKNNNPAGICLDEKKKNDGLIEKPETDIPEVKKPEIKEIPPGNDEPELEDTEIAEVPGSIPKEMPDLDEETTT